MEDLVPVNLLLMANTVRHQGTKNIANIFDLKGSIINRSVKITAKTKNTSTLKDVNLQLIKKQRQSENYNFMMF